MTDASGSRSRRASGGGGTASGRARLRVIRTFHDRLFDAYGPQHWWPAETALEVVIGAILTQNTAWRNVERAIAALRGAGALHWGVLRDLTLDRLETLIRPAGTFRVKARRLRSFVETLWRDSAGSLEHFLDGDLEAARGRLLSVHGIGPETADAILLYAGGHPSFVVDAYTRRVLRRHYLAGAEASYDQVRELFLEALPTDAALFNEYHALLVQVGKRHCRAHAICDGCPLARFRHDPEL